VALLPVFLVAFVMLAFVIVPAFLSWMNRRNGP